MTRARAYLVATAVPASASPQGRYPDVQLVSAEKNVIQIDQVRSIQSDAALSPLEGRRKVFIIREIERATAPAANALLKTLEEPPPQVILVLTCVRRDRVLPTILSRCQVIGLRALPLTQVQNALEQRWGVDPDRAALLARLSSGRLGWAVSTHTDPQIWERRAKRLDELQAVTAGGQLPAWLIARRSAASPMGSKTSWGCGRPGGGISCLSNVGCRMPSLTWIGARS